MELISPLCLVSSDGVRLVAAYVGRDSLSCCLRSQGTLGGLGLSVGILGGLGLWRQPTELGVEQLEGKATAQVWMRSSLPRTAGRDVGKKVWCSVLRKLSESNIKVAVATSACIVGKKQLWREAG